MMNPPHPSLLRVVSLDLSSPGALLLRARTGLPLLDAAVERIAEQNTVEDTSAQLPSAVRP